EAGQQRGSGTRPRRVELSNTEFWQRRDAGLLILQGWSGSDCNPHHYRARDPGPNSGHSVGTAQPSPPHWTLWHGNGRSPSWKIYIINFWQVQQTACWATEQ
ncbi:Hypothetical predicted protein, partial [Marmota monax]